MALNILRDTRKRMTVKERAEQDKNNLTQLLKAKDMSIEEKQDLIKERNEFLFIFGEKLLPQGNDDYATYINKLYLGE